MLEKVKPLKSFRSLFQESLKNKNFLRCIPFLLIIKNYVIVTSLPKSTALSQHKVSPY